MDFQRISFFCAGCHRRGYHGRAPRAHRVDGWHVPYPVPSSSAGRSAVA